MKTFFIFALLIGKLYISEVRMLINFTVGNFRSLKERRTLSLEASAIKELSDSVFVENGYRILPSAVIYGANSSGKSNFLKGIDTFMTMVTQSSKMNSTDKLNVESFLLNPRTAQEPSFFEIELLTLTQKVYRYGFIANEHKILEEWLFKIESPKKETCLFIRTEEGIGMEDGFEEGKGLEEKTRDNALFLSVVDSFNGEISKDLVRSINQIVVISGLDHEAFSKFTRNLCTQYPDLLAKAEDLFKHLNIGFNYFEIPKEEEVADKIKAYTLHNLYDDEGNIIGEVRLNMKDYESSGTNKLFDLGMLVIAVLYTGGVLVVDELDSKLHPLLTQYIIRLFNDPDKNTGKGQLIFATHDTNLLNANLFRRDQIWFTEKDETESSDLYSLVEFREPDGTKVRNDRSFEKDYIKGRYGAIPYIKG